MQELNPLQDLQRALLPDNHESQQRRVDDTAARSYTTSPDRPGTRRNRV